MKKKITKLLSLLLALGLCVGILPMTAFAETGETQEIVQTQLEKVQTLIDALPETVTAETKAEVIAQLEGIDIEKAKLSDEEIAQLSTARYEAVCEALGALENQPTSEPEVIEVGGECTGGDGCNHQASVGSVHYNTIGEAIDALNASTTGGTLKILAACTDSKQITIASGATVVVDLNGKTVTDPCINFLYVQAGGKLTVQDSSSEGTGTITTSQTQIILSYGEVEMTGGKLISTKNTSGARCVYITGEGGSFKMTGGTISGQKMSTSYGALHIGNGATAEISGGTVFATNCAVVVKGGTLNVLGSASITASNALKTSGSSAVMTVSGGTVDGALNLFGYSSVTISGGTFQNTSAKITDEDVGPLTVANNITALNSTNITTSVKGYVVKAMANGENTVYSLAIDPASAAARIGETYYAKFWDAANAVQDGETITLNADNLNLGSSTLLNKSFTIDLAGHTASGLTVYDGCDITVTDTAETKGGLNAENFIGYEYGIEVHPGGTATVAEGVTVYGVNGEPAIFVGEMKEESDKVATLNVYGTVDGRILNHGTDQTGGTVINIYDPAVIKDDVLGIYHPGMGTVNMYGGMVTGATGIEMRSGTLNVTGGEIIGTGAWSVLPNGSGSTVSGAGVAVSQHGTNLEININISGGKITGTKHGLYEEDTVDNVTENVKVNITDGVFTATSTDADASAVASENQTGFIQGGYFSTKPEDKEIAQTVKTVIKLSDANAPEAGNVDAPFTIGTAAEEALANAKTGEEITLLKSDGNLTLPEGVEITNATGGNIVVNGESVANNDKATSAHIHKYGEAWNSDATNHWHECSCGAKAEVNAHTPGAAATETTAQTCTECGYVITPALGHIHSYGTEWKTDATNHWHECSCGAKAEEAAHGSSDWMIDKDASATEKGSKHKECTICGCVLETAEIPATGTTTPTDPADKDDQDSNNKPESNPNTGTDIPETGDTNNMLLWAVLLAVSGCSIVALLMTRKRKRAK